ncbi:type II toxin-antitoxin system Phd/YefM family antitoxin [Methanoregula sp.]|uniref:type II toxin-antitoxin system Phd/YefM family antitoxin n=1 Tax=Methanoregula sp. TaxID=2052170 RepID=UPI00236A37C6|nr:type II toxin-antitoxin system Phd/YefM family antitoxin [Methanoregula sp.]MDD1686290.1 type II toxin-antitoxin system Phd/YefM family antitoxin [Methanoregula sp.]
MSAVEQHVVDENGNKVAVILPLTEYQHLKEDLHDLAMVAERRDEGTISLAELKKTRDVIHGHGNIRSNSKER